MEGQSSAEFSQYSYQSEQWSRLLRRNSPAQSTLSNTPGFVAPPHLPTHFELVPILLPQQSTYHRAQLLQYNKLIASARSAHLQALPLPPLLSAEHIQAVPRQRSTSTNVNTDRNAKVSSRGGHGNREARKLSKGERALIAEKDEIATMPSKKFDLPNPLPARPLAQHQNSSLSMQSNSVPSTPHQHARKFSFESREPSPNAATSHSPRSAYSESDSKLNILKPLPPRDFRKGGCIYETAQAKSRRRMPYSIGEAKLEKLDPSKIKSKLTKDEERKLTTDMRELYDRLLPTPDKELRRQKLVQKLEKLLNEEWPGNDIKVLMYGSSGNLLCTDESDVDLCITTSWKGLDTCMISDLLARNGMEQVVCISTAKVPIVKIWDPELSLACDMNINETVAIENTRMIKTYVQIDDRVRPLAMVIKHWTKERALNDAGSLFVLSSYTWMCLIINFLQTREPPIVPALHQRQHLKLPPKEGQGESSFADDVEALKKLGEKNTETLGELLFHFFRFYGHEFDYDNLVVSVRNGKQIPKKEKGPNFLGANPWALCVEEPFNVTRNLGNTADGFSFRGLHMELRRAFDLISDAKLGECCEKFEWPPEEKPFWEKRAPQPKPILSRSASQSNRGGRNGHHRGGRNNHGRNNNGNRRASSGAFDSNGVYLPQGVPSNMTPENAWFQQQQAQAQLHNELFTKYTVLQAEEIRLRQYQAFQQQQAAHQAQVYSQAQSRKTANGSATKQQPSDRNRTTSFDQPPLTAPIRPDMYFYPLQFHQTPVYAYSGSSTNPPSPSMSSALPELRRSVHRSSVTNGSGPNSAQSSSSLRSHSQPATRTVQGVPMPDNGLGMYQAMHYANTQPIPSFMADENLDPAYEALSKRPMNRAPDDSIPKEYVGYYVNNSTASTPRRQPQASLAIPAFGDVGQRRRLSTDQFPQSILDRLKRTSRSPSPLGDGRRDRSCSVDAPLVPGSTTPTQHNVSSTNLKALNNQGPVVVNGSHFPMPTVASTWQATKSDRSVSEDHSSDVAVGSYSSISHGSDFGSEISADPIFSGSSTPKNTHESDRVQQPMVVNGSSPIRGNDPVRTTHAMAPPTGATSYHDSKPANPANELVPTEKLNGALRLSPNAQRTSRPQNGGMSPLDIGFAHNDTAPHLSPVYETRTPSPTANRKFEPGMERIVNGANCNAKDAKAEKLNPISKFAPVNGSQLKSSSADAKSNGHTRASKSEGSGPHSWQKASKQKKKGQASDPKTASNGHPLGERLPHNESERKGG